MSALVPPFFEPMMTTSGRRRVRLGSTCPSQMRSKSSSSSAMSSAVSSISSSSSSSTPPPPPPLWATHQSIIKCKITLYVIYLLITDSVIKNYVALPNSDLLGAPLGHPRRHVPLHRPRRLRLARVDGEHGGGEEDRKMAQYEPHLDLPSSFPSRPPSRNKCAVSPPTRLFTLTSSPQFERKGKWTDGRVGENPKIAPNRSEEGERTPRCSLAAAEAKQHLDIIRVSPLNVNPAGEIMLGERRSLALNEISRMATGKFGFQRPTYTNILVLLMHSNHRLRERD